MTYSSFTMKQRKGMYWANTLKDSNIDIYSNNFVQYKVKSSISLFHFLSEFIRVLFT